MKMMREIREDAGFYRRSFCADTHRRWVPREAVALRKVLLKEGVEQAAMFVTGLITDGELKPADKPDGMYLERVRQLVEDNRELVAEVILSGGEE